MNTQTSISFPAIGQNDQAWRDNLTDKANQAVLADIWNLLKTYSTKAFWFKNFNSNDHNGLPFYLTTGKSFFFTPDIGLVNFNMAMQQISSRDQPSHDAACATNSKLFGNSQGQEFVEVPRHFLQTSGSLHTILPKATYEEVYEYPQILYQR